MRKSVLQHDATTAVFLLVRFRQAVRLFASLFFALPLLASAHFDPAKASVAANGIAITVAPGNWGEADLRDIQQVLESVANELRAQVAYPSDATLNIRVVPRSGAPRVLYQRGPAGEYVVQLTARNERWFQYAYQFSHELCHIFSNFDHKEMKGNEAVTDNQWFEETLCETASLSTLKHLALSWADTPPARKWVGYAPAFAAYADYLMAAEHRRLPDGQSLSRWYRENQAPLRENPYQREKNELAANALLPLFESTSGTWRAIRYLNPDKSAAGKGFDAYLAAWHAACPEEQKELVRQTMALFGIGPVGTNQTEQVSLLDQPTDPFLHH